MHQSTKQRYKDTQEECNTKLTKVKNSLYVLIYTDKGLKKSKSAQSVHQISSFQYVKELFCRESKIGSFTSQIQGLIREVSGFSNQPFLHTEIWVFENEVGKFGDTTDVGAN